MSLKTSNPDFQPLPYCLPVPAALMARLPLAWNPRDHRCSERPLAETHEAMDFFEDSPRRPRARSMPLSSRLKLMWLKYSGGSGRLLVLMGTAPQRLSSAPSRASSRAPDASVPLHPPSLPLWPSAGRPACAFLQAFSPDRFAPQAPLFGPVPSPFSCSLPCTYAKGAVVSPPLPATHTAPGRQWWHPARSSRCI